MIWGLAPIFTGTSGSLLIGFASLNGANGLFLSGSSLRADGLTLNRLPSFDTAGGSAGENKLHPLRAVWDGALEKKSPSA